MKYLLMCCHEEKKWDSMSKSECDAVMEETMAYVEALKKSGQLHCGRATRPHKDGHKCKSPEREVVRDRRSLC